MSHLGLASKERGRLPMQCASAVRRPTSISGARRARAVVSLASPPPERQAAQWHARALYNRSWLLVEGRS